MNLAFFSPFPPKQTGVAAYSQVLVRAVRQIATVTAFDHQNEDLLATDPQAVDFAATPEVLTQLDQWDLPIFSLGNNPYYHLEILRTSFRNRGLLLLHDTVLYYLFAGMRPGSFHRHFCETYGAERAHEIEQIRAYSPEGNVLRYPAPANYSFLAAAVRHAEAVIVHNRHAEETIKAVSPHTIVHRLPLLAHVPPHSVARRERAAELRKSVVRNPGEILLGSFGFLGSTKRLTSVCAALKALPATLAWHFVIVGDGPDPQPEFAAAGLAERVAWMRYVPDTDYDAWIEATDIVLNLRYPSMGESSATLSRAMGMGKACVVTDHASFSELPDDTVWKIPYDKSEVPKVTEAIVALAHSPGRRAAIGQEAGVYTEREHAAPQVAARLVDIANETLRLRAHQTVRAVKPSAESAGLIRDHFEKSVRSVLPSHLKTGAVAVPEQLPQLVPLELTREDVIWSYRALLSRDPHHELEIPAMLRSAGSIVQLRRMILDSDEFRRKNSPL
jgi:glycosyltransferase involved in cell wall biosynthesis